ncbi:hypothetical protein CBL_09768 [Carabus blaptoides fortunei]
MSLQNREYEKMEESCDDIELPFHSSYGERRVALVPVTVVAVVRPDACAGTPSEGGSIAHCQTCRIQNEIPLRCISTRTLKSIGVDFADAFDVPSKTRRVRHNTHAHTQASGVSEVGSLSTGGRSPFIQRCTTKPTVTS